MAHLNPHITFNGNCREAFDFYKSIFGGEFSTVMTYADVPPGAPAPPANPTDIIHMALPLSKDSLLMGCDMPQQFGQANLGNAFNVSLTVDSRAEADRVFNGLSDGAKHTMPMSDTFWGAYFGMLTDKYGVQWMVSFDQNQQ